jgi:hypothetical protein
MDQCRQMKRLDARAPLRAPTTTQPEQTKLARQLVNKEKSVREIAVTVSIRNAAIDRLSEMAA